MDAQDERCKSLSVGILYFSCARFNVANPRVILQKIFRTACNKLLCTYLNFCLKNSPCDKSNKSVSSARDMEKKVSASTQDVEGMVTQVGERVTTTPGQIDALRGGE
jgi:hypothetical protein